MRVLSLLQSGAAAILLSSVSVAHAADQAASGLLKYVYALSDGGIALTFQVDPANCPGPGPGKYLYIYAGQYGTNALGAKNMYAQALAAKLANRVVTVGFDDSTTSCFINRLRIED